MAVQTATASEMMKELMIWTSAQNVKVYRKHGAGGDLYGVSFADLRRLARRIKTDHVLALELWESGNLDARLLAAMIADPEELTPATVDSWIEDVDYYVLCGELAELHLLLARWLSRPWKGIWPHPGSTTVPAVTRCSHLP